MPFTVRPSQGGSDASAVAGGAAISKGGRPTVPQVQQNVLTGERNDARIQKEAGFDPAGAAQGGFGPARPARPASRDAMPAGLTRAAQAVFERVDRNNDGFLSHRELRQAMGDPSIQGEEAAAVVALARRGDVIQALSDDEFGIENDGITRADLNALERTGGPVRAAAEASYQRALGRIEGTNRLLFPYGVAGIHHGAVEQGSLGDCYFLAAVAGLARTNPGAIQRMIRENGDGTYTVTFPGREPVTVATPTDAEIGRYASSGFEGLWLSVLEKGYAAMRNRDDLINVSGGYEHLGGGRTGEGIEHLTGRSTTTYWTNFNSAERLLGLIRTATSQGRLVIASVSRDFLVFGPSQREGVPTKHAYTVLGVNDDGRIVVRNPWGFGGPDNDGRYTFAPDDFDRIFSRVAIEDR